MSEEWTTVDLKSKHAFGKPKGWDCPEILLQKYCWVITQRVFVSIENPKRIWSEQMFNEAFQHVQPPNNLTPSRYIREMNREDRVVNHMEMEPKEKATVYTDKEGLKVLNLFKQNPLQPEQITETPKLFLEHLNYIYEGKQEHIEHVLRWMAHMLYSPEKRINHGLCLSGNQGTGKSTLALVLKKLVGEQARMITPQMFTSSFHDWMTNIRLAVVEEIREFNKHGSYNKVKHLFTEDVVPINPKGKPSYDLKNHVHFMFFSNHHFPMSLEQGDRRIHYVHSNVTRKEPEYYEKLFNYLDLEGDMNGVFAFGNYLRKEILPNLPNNFATNPPPQTVDHKRAVSASSNPLEEIILELRSGGLGIFQGKRFFRWRDFKRELQENSQFHEANIMRNPQEFESLMARLKLSKEKHVIKGKQETVAWFNDDKDFDAQLRKLFKDNSKKGRASLYEIFIDDPNKGLHSYNEFMVEN